MEQVLLPGFRFYPTEEELITFYLHHKLHGHGPDLDRVIPSVDVYNFEPPQLPGLAGRMCLGEMEQWFFFMPRQEREARGGRPNRTTASGYWKATGSPSYVYSSQNKVVGLKKTMVFYKGKAPTGRKTKWKMNEYKALKQDETANYNSANASSNNTTLQLRHELSLYRVYVTSGCARAFDRRPPGAIPSVTNTQNEGNCNDQCQVGQGSGTALMDVNATTTLSMERSGSTDCSKSGGGNDHAVLQDDQATPTLSSNSTYEFDQMAQSNLDLIWDWEQLSWC